MRLLRGSLCVLVVLAGLQGRVGADDFDSGLAGFTAHMKSFACPYRVLGVFVSPGEELVVEIDTADRTGAYVCAATQGRVMRRSPYSWVWSAPQEKGSSRLTLHRSDPVDSMLFRVFVMVPRSQVREGKLNGYRIGRYPQTAYKGMTNYKPPVGFVEVTRQNENTRLSPHFRLGQFVCKQEGGYPRYVVIQEELLLKLELILRRVNEEGIRCGGFHVMSGYRTPYYNAAIGNVKYSRHQWGDAADIFVDENPRDGVMDDLNGDRRINWKDAAVLYDIIDAMYGTPVYDPFVGGLARYRKTERHGPFVHIDVRGFRARWGD
ncbi:MAG TPA: D-Ala-D-Ala carboxypeptidase family metallohydrolase [Acidobacteriota bacterium]|nr:D-Ala-D-Ala carboxypeptidase family metallohydrolase [Acidobacteriota bacterium]